MEEKGAGVAENAASETVMTERRQDSRGAQQRLESSQSGETAMAWLTILHGGPGWRNGQTRWT